MPRHARAQCSVRSVLASPQHCPARAACLRAAEQTDVAYQEVKEVRSVGRGVGLWGDMVVVLNDDSKVEMRSVDR